MNEASSLTRQLHREHLNTLSVLSDLEIRVINNASNPIDISDRNDRFRLEDFVRMIDEDLLRHYRFEEEIVFPRLIDVGFGPITDMLSMEHETIRGIAGGLRSTAVIALQGGFTPSSWSEFRDGIMDLVHSVNFHIQKEEMGVIRQLDMVLGAGVDRELGALYAAFA